MPASENAPITAHRALIFLSELHGGLYSTESQLTKEGKCAKASNSELRRWIERGSVEINGHVDRDPKEVIDYPVLSVVIHPKSAKRRTTLLWRHNA